MQDDFKDFCGKYKYIMQFLNFKSWLLNENVRLPEELYKPILVWLQQQFYLAYKGADIEIERKFNLNTKCLFYK